MKKINIILLSIGIIAILITSIVIDDKPSVKAISTQGLVGYWKMDDNLPTTAVIDETGVNNGAFNDTNGNPNTDTHSVVSHHERALTFDGEDDYVNCGGAASLEITGTLTYEDWIKPTAFNLFPIIVQKYFSTAGKTLYINITRKLAGKVPYSTTTALSYSNELIVLNVWQYVAMTLEDNIVRLYINGQEVTYATQTAGVGTETDLTIRSVAISQAATGYAFTGIIDEVRIYNRALGADEIALHYFLGSETRIK